MRSRAAAVGSESSTWVRGNGWLSNRLSERGHTVTAIDLSDDPFDGLGAARHYNAPFKTLLAEFDHLPLADKSVDLAIFNASLHYRPITCGP